MSGWFLVLAAAGGLPAGEPAPPSAAPAPAPAPQTVVLQQVVPTRLAGLTSGLRAQVQLLRAEVQAVRTHRDRVRERHQAGLAPAAEVEQAEHRAAVAEIALREAEAKLAQEERLAVLERPLNLSLADATLRQAAVALSEAAGMPVILAEDIPLEKRLTLDARGVTLGLLLETVAQKTDLMIAPDPRGFLIRRWPTLQVDGQRIVRRSSAAPWSDEWTGYLFFGDRAVSGTPFASGGGVVFSRGGPDGFATELPGGGEDVPAAPQPVPALPGAPSIPGGPPSAAYLQHQAAPHPIFGGFGPLGPPSLAPVGDRMVVIAEPGVGEKGEAGYWLTVYRLEGDRLRRASSIFHPAARRGGMLDYLVPGFVPPRSSGPVQPARPAPPRRVLPESAPPPAAPKGQNPPPKPSGQGAGVPSPR